MTVAAGWHPDPTNPSQLRWWDGAAWSQHTHPATPPVAPAAAHAPQPQFATSPQFAAGVAPSAPLASGYGTAAPGLTPTAAPTRAAGNTFSFITMGVVAVYLVLALSAHIVVLGILPVLMSVRAVRAKERLAWVAAGCAGVAVLVALVALTSR